VGVAYREAPCLSRGATGQPGQVLDVHGLPERGAEDCTQFPDEIGGVHGSDTNPAPPARH